MKIAFRLMLALMIALAALTVFAPDPTTAQGDAPAYVQLALLSNVATCAATQVTFAQVNLAISVPTDQTATLDAQQYVDGALYASNTFEFNSSSFGGPGGPAIFAVFASTTFPYTLEIVYDTYYQGELVFRNVTTAVCDGAGDTIATQTNTAYPNIPGCDVAIGVPSTAVGGSFVAPADVYWAPGQLVDPALSIAAGNTALVLGVDSSGDYYKVIWGCQYLWVPVSSMGPNFDAVWQGAPLPTGVVN